MIRIFLFAMCAAVSFSSITSAGISVFEPFNYGPDGSDVAGNGGSGSFGFSDNWSGNTSFDLVSGSLISPVSFPPVIGNRVTADSFGGNRDLARTLSQPLGADNTEAYMSFLMQAEDEVGEGAFNGWFAFVLRAGGRNVTVGKESFSNQYKVEGNTGEIALSSVPVVADQSHLFVLHADFLPGADIFRLYIDPPTGQPQPIVADATMSTFDVGIVSDVGLAGPGAFGFDELRIGSTWQDVARAPEPPSLFLLVVACFVGRIACIKRVR